jgi:Kef-type K+ transport system membrane component KefB
VDQLLVWLAVIFIAGRLGGEAAQRLRQPVVVGEILAGVLVGPAVLGWVPAHHDAIVALAELGVIFLLFTVGLEAGLHDVRRVGAHAVGVAVGGVVLPFVAGGALMLLLGRRGPEALFVGTAMVATSVAVTARVLQDKGKLASREAGIILGAAVLDDIIALLMLTVVTGVADGDFSLSSTLVLVGEALAFLLVLGLVGRRVAERVMPRVDRLQVSEPVLGVSVALVLVLAAAAARVGLAAIIGAFLAGVILARAGEDHELEEKMRPLTSFLVPFFFVHVGSLVDLGRLASAGTLALGLAITLLALVSKVVGSGAAAMGLGTRSATIVGVGMAPRGEVGMIVASLGLGLGIIDEELYGVVVLMALLTTLIAPPLLAALFAKGDTHEAPGKPPSAR